MPGPGELERSPFRLGPRAPAGLPSNTPVWTHNGEIHFGPTGLFLGSDIRRRMLRHEGIHRLHQRRGWIGDGPGARDTAEQLASRSELSAQAGFQLPESPAPSLLAFAPQNYEPWNQVFIGNAGIIGEIEDSGVRVRIFFSYKEIGITKSPESQTYHCAPTHEPKPIPETVTRMHKLARQAAGLNAKILQSSARKITLVVLDRDANSSFRVNDTKGTGDGQGVLIVNSKDSWEDVVAHEASHAIFAGDLGEPDPAGKPDVFAKKIAELFVELKETAQVSIPTRPFGEFLPPLRVDASGTAEPAGLVMVLDTLWADRKALPGGHPWDTPDEFFASAFGMFQNRALFDRIVNHYAKADAKISALAGQLSNLLSMVGNAPALKTLGAPVPTFITNLRAKFIPQILLDWQKQEEKRISSAADTALKTVKPTPKISEGVPGIVSQLVDPDNLLIGPPDIICPAKPAGKAATSPKAREK